MVRLCVCTDRRYFVLKHRVIRGVSVELPLFYTFLLRPWLATEAMTRTKRDVLIRQWLKCLPARRPTRQ